MQFAYSKFKLNITEVCFELKYYDLTTLYKLLAECDFIPNLLRTGTGLASKGFGSLRSPSSLLRKLSYYRLLLTRLRLAKDCKGSNPFLI